MTDKYKLHVQAEGDESRVFLEDIKRTIEELASRWNTEYPHIKDRGDTRITVNMSEVESGW